jgi:DNA-binding NarL/FixJ family response regulator
MMRIVIVDDQKLFRQNLKKVIELSIPDAQVVGVAGDGQEALDIIQSVLPDLVLLDMRMPVMDGVECIRRLRQEGNNVKVIVLTTFDDDEYVFEALRYDVAGYLLKDIEPEELTAAINQVEKGATLVSPRVTTKLVAEVRRHHTAESAMSRDVLSRLTQREMEVLRHMAMGEDNRETALSMQLAEGTIKNHISVIYEKLEVRDRAQAIRIAILAGIA